MYRIVYTKQAAKSLKKMPRSLASLIRGKLDQVATDPFAQHPNVTKLQNRTGYRLRIGDRRVIYDVQNDEFVVMVLKIAPRGEVYR